MNGLAELALRCPTKVVFMLRCMEKDSKPTPGTFRPLEGIADPADFDDFMRSYLAEPKKTVDKLKFHCENILTDRYWKWLLNHPDLGEERIHPSRSVPPFSLIPLSPHLYTLPFSTF